MKKIRVYDIEYLALIDVKYAKRYAYDNQLTEEEKEEWLNGLEEKTEVIIYVDDDFEDEDELANYLELEELCEYITDFQWEYLAEQE
jgi:hypothetical protein